MHYTSVFIFVLLQLLVISVFAFETDNFTCRHAKLEDVTQHVNAETNRRIRHVLEKGSLQMPYPPKKKKKFEKGSSGSGSSNDNTTKPSKVMTEDSDPTEIDPNDPKNYKPLVGCDRTELHLALRGVLASSWMGNLESWAQEQPFSKCLPETNIYNTDGAGLMLRSAGINYTIKVGGVNIGADKLSHFMTEGADYYEEQMRGGNLKSILSIGENEENQHYGLMTTGVKSYGDLVANYQGYQFWKNTTEGNDPFFKCINNKWTQVKQFDWANFVNPLMDESINCSKYRTKEFADGVAKNVEALQKSHNVTPLKCPLDIEACQKVSAYIPIEEARKAIVHPDCLNVTAPSAAKIGVQSETVR